MLAPISVVIVTVICKIFESGDSKVQFESKVTKKK